MLIEWCFTACGVAGSLEIICSDSIAITHIIGPATPTTETATTASVASASSTVNNAYRAQANSSTSRSEVDAQGQIQIVHK
jgi:hypothetical protein